MGTGKVQHKNNRKLSFFVIDLYKGMTKAGGDVPVNGPYIVPGLIFAYLGKLNPPAFKGTFILTCKKVIGQTVGLEMKPLYLFE
jgi:hypothetical protein